MVAATMRNHPFRQAIMDEVHARPVEIVPSSCRVRRLILVASSRPGSVAAQFARFRNWCVAEGVPVPPQNARQHGYTVGARHVTWEFHTEFVTVTWSAALTDGEVSPSGIGLEALDDVGLIGATRIDVIDVPSVPDRLLPGFRLNSLCVADIEGDRAQVVTDFVPDEHSFTRFELAAGELSELRRAIVVRRLLEIETYRTMALMALPLARQLSPQLQEMEVELAANVEGLAEATSTEKAQLALESLHALSIRSGQLSERLSFRFAASNAYGEILGARLAALNEQPTGKGSTLSRYIGNRVDPALATYGAMEKRLSVLSAKIERAVRLLDVRIGLDMQIQNKTVLETIAKTAQSQFRLQHTVEGLSTIAISYYLLGIISYALAGPFEFLHVDKVTAVSFVAPLAVFGVWLTARAVRKRHSVH